ncbi:hypothetical protein mvi_61140 (plasmid) [Methylobacterium indicum]|uniref:Uncharacterized protein n=1 Tax=Methylobacterium indicum TaxID=1775910 RepID=A0A8H8X028_9HYPH|nr:hypothetical protein mvi_61140 [Methylobacterium indicum]
MANMGTPLTVKVRRRLAGYPTSNRSETGLSKMAFTVDQDVARKGTEAASEQVKGARGFPAMLAPELCR